MQQTDTSADESSKEKVPLPQRSAITALSCHLSYHEITRGGGNEIERQNPQTAASDEPTDVRRSKRQRDVCCIYRRNSRRLR